jgi:hypothetical protein
MVWAVERRVDLSNLDLDRAAVIITDRCARWREFGFSVGALTWVDNDAGWPAPLLTDRGQVGRPMSVGVQMQRESPEAWALFVLYAGGWADVDYVAVDWDAVVAEYVELDNAEEFAAVMDRALARLTGAQHRP